MRNQIRQRLQTQAHVEIAESRIYQNDQSFIHQLRDLVDEDHQSNEQTNFPDRKAHNSYKTGVLITNSFTNLKHLRLKNELNKQLSSDKLQGGFYNRKRADSYRMSQDISLRQYGVPNIQNFQASQKFKKFPTLISSLPPLPVLQQKKQVQNSNIKLKYQYNRSNLIKNQEQIKNLLKNVNKCEHCNEIKSQVYRNKILCKNKKCRLINLYEDYQTFPLIGLLYDIENPSCTCDELEEFVKKIRQEVEKIEKWRNDLIELQFELKNIIETKKQSQRPNKSQLRSFLHSLSEQKQKKQPLLPLKHQLALKTQLQNLQLRSLYEQFSRWNKIDLQKYQNSKFIGEAVQQYKPLCLKFVNQDFLEPLWDLSEGFSNGVAVINASEYFGFNFFGNINKMVINLDGSIQLKRDNFLLIQNLHSLKLNFKSRKTSRELRQLFNILPNIKKLSFDFDYKIHSHLSCQAFPLLSKAFQIAEEQLSINISNARPEIFEDLIAMSKKSVPKLSLKLRIEMNPFVEGDQSVRNSEWGTKLAKNILKMVGNKIHTIQLQFPFELNHQQISEFILNSDFNMLIDLKIKCKETETRVLRQNNMKQLLGSIVRKKKLLMSYLLNQKRQKSHPLNKNRILLQSVYQVLF